MLPLKAFLMINAGIAFIFGVSFLFIPHLFVSTYGLVLDPVGLVFTRSLGGGLLGLSLIVAIVGNSNDQKSHMGLIIGGLALHIANGITDFHAVWIGTMDKLGYSVVIMHAVLALGFIYFLNFKSVKQRK